MILLLPADPMRPRRPDEHFAAEATAARDLGFDVVLVDHDALARPADPEGPAPARTVARTAATGAAFYRGWMLRAGRYAALAAVLRERGIALRTTPEQYRRAHELPGWYTDLADVTPYSVWTTGADRAGFDRARAAFGSGPAVLRDHTKSMKHHFDEAAYIADVADADAAWRVASRFLELRDDEFVGGLVLRRFERFVSAEVRTWWVDGRPALVTAHPDTPDRPAPADVDLSEVAPLVAALRLPFVTADLVLRDDGRWRVVELGDGQVSDRPAGTDSADLLAALRPAAR
ncbi:ATP-grasp domain-containing protein [Polymorphospora sp. NPDC050346]|uniref:ATP-grasp domain-containing protein n=1 Tax=Polymorphospora sp. NPDC050346 TaxID=3155780 RepID=UPI0033F20B33